ncbi:alkaline phosphatase family protein [Actinacidiphila acidipaludis]|uniref:Alkaline phosphatase family protein n=1 Tax=Actinacidiphila acidipaludis TaxID=2873382 RepID=A0ABS7QII4_9ACTN|nr:alkaline phosphatase family protein [Streptomyces acidipaludis]MBY8882983.1 alkaline phosphatase family protein [Streptomyces acidipaludis]
MRLRGSSIAGLLALLGALLVFAPPPARAAAGSGNLIVNGDAEAGGYCTGDWAAATTVPGWTTQAGGPDVMCSTVGSFALPGDGKTPGRGFFGPGNFGDGSMAQTVDVSSAAAAVDTGAVTFDLSGWLGGWTTYSGYVAVSLHFHDASGRPVGAAVKLPTVSAADRGQATAFLARNATGSVPAGTRSVQVEVQFLSTASETGYLDNLSLTLDTPVAASPLIPPPSHVPGYDHVFVVMMENTDYAQVMNDPADTPFMHSLMTQGATLTDAHGVYHPSDENYLAVAGGDTYARGATYWPNINSPERNLGDTLEAAGKSWKAYEQGMGTPCNTKNTYDSYYEPDDAPFINYTDVSTDAGRCAAHLADTSQLTTDLQSAASTPDFAWIAADDYYDGEASGNGSAASLRTQDGWLRQTLGPVLASPAFTEQRSLIVLTWDESDSEAYNHLATVLVGSRGTVPAGTSSPLHYDHYGIGRTIEAALGLPGLTANDTYATPLNAAFVPSGATAPTLTGDLNAVANGGNVTLRYTVPSAAQVSAKNWVGIYPAGVTPGGQPSLTWAYAPNAGGALTFATGKLNGPGTYGVYYLANDGYSVLAGPFTLTVG